MLKVATWNVNGIRARIERVLAWLRRESPDIVCLQEIKASEADFPFPALADEGYHSTVHGQKGFNGVAVLTRTPPSWTEAGMNDGEDDPQARLVAVDTGGILAMSAYVPNGQDVGSDKYSYKLKWLRRLGSRLKGLGIPKRPALLCGDFNIAPDERDVHDPHAWEGTVLYNPEVRAEFRALVDLGLVDTFRLHHRDGGLFSWWDYRRLSFPRNEGLRIDFVMATPTLAERCIDAYIDRSERKGSKPSDHAPVVAIFSD